MVKWVIYPCPVKFNRFSLIAEVFVKFSNYRVWFKALNGEYEINPNNNTKDFFLHHYPLIFYQFCNLSFDFCVWYHKPWPFINSVAKVNAVYFMMLKSMCFTCHSILLQISKAKLENPLIKSTRFINPTNFGFNFQRKESSDFS